eukprot:m51a1_g11329 hypothetical protein (232) ;mRNA; f:131515-132562
MECSSAKCSQPPLSLGREPVSPSQQPPRIWASANKIYFTTPFQVTFSAGSAWMARNGATLESVRAAAYGASALLEGDDLEPLPPCQRCSRASKCVITLGFLPDTAGEMIAARAEQTDEGEYVVQFDYCRSGDRARNCNSSRLHFGGRVVIALAIRDMMGNVVARPVSQPLSLCSKPPAGKAAASPLSDSSDNRSSKTPSDMLMQKVIQLENEATAHLLRVQILKQLIQSRL